MSEQDKWMLALVAGALLAAYIANRKAVQAQASTITAIGSVN